MVTSKHPSVWWGGLLLLLPSCKSIAYCEVKHFFSAQARGDAAGTVVLGLL